MKKLLSLCLMISLLTLVSISTTFAFDPTLASKPGLAVKAEFEASSFGLEDGGPAVSMQLYGAGTTYTFKDLGTKLGLSVGGAIVSFDKALGNKDFSDTTMYVSLGASQPIGEIFGVSLGLFADDTYLARAKDKFQGEKVYVNNLNLVRAGAIAQAEVMKDLTVYTGLNGQWLTATAEAGGSKQGLDNNTAVNGFLGIKYNMGPYAIDVNAGCADRVKVGANIAYSF